MIPMKLSPMNRITDRPEEGTFQRLTIQQSSFDDDAELGIHAQFRNRFGPRARPTLVRPWWQFHLFLSALQLGFAVVILSVSNAFTRGGPEVIGHLGIGALVVAIGIYHMIHFHHKSWQDGLISDGYATIFGATAYIIVELATNQRPWSTFGYWSNHIAFCLWMIILGVLAVAVGKSRTRTLARLPVFLCSVAWVIFVLVHVQPNEFGAFAHGAAGIWILLGGAAKLMDRNFEAGSCFVLSGYNLFAGQKMLCDWAQERFLVSSYILWWHAWASLIVTAYIHQLIRKEGHGENSIIGFGRGSPMLFRDATTAADTNTDTGRSTPPPPPPTPAAVGMNEQTSSQLEPLTFSSPTDTEMLTPDSAASSDNLAHVHFSDVPLPVLE